jgi:hypothetical protein
MCHSQIYHVTRNKHKIVYYLQGTKINSITPFHVAKIHSSLSKLLIGFIIILNKIMSVCSSLSLGYKSLIRQSFVCKTMFLSVYKTIVNTNFKLVRSTACHAIHSQFDIRATARAIRAVPRPKCLV